MGTVFPLQTKCGKVVIIIIIIKKVKIIVTLSIKNTAGALSQQFPCKLSPGLH